MTVLEVKRFFAQLFEQRKNFAVMLVTALCRSVQ